MHPYPENKTLTAWWLLLAAFCLFAAVLFPRAAQSPFYIDDYTLIVHSQRIADNPWAAWEPDTDQRRHPLLYYWLFAESRLFGANVAGYHALMYAFHFINVLGIVILGRKMGIGKAAAAAAGLIFLFSSSYCQALVVPNGRPLFLSLLLTSLICWMSFLERPCTKYFLLTLSLSCIVAATGDEGIVLPFIAGVLTVLYPPADSKQRRRVWIFIAILLGAVGLIFLAQLGTFFHSGDRERWVKPGFLNPAFLLHKALSLGGMLVVRPGLLEEGFLRLTGGARSWLRILPGFLIVVGLLAFLGKKGRPRHLTEHFSWRPALAALAWIGITAAPYFPATLPFHHATRYLYLPTVGFGLLAGPALSGLICPAMQPSKNESILLAAIVIAAIVLNLNAMTYHYWDYQNFVRKNPQEDYSERFRELFTERRNR